MEAITLPRQNQPAAAPQPHQPPPPRPADGGRGSDPTRSGALWIGGTGVALLLSAAAVLTAVRWDDIGQTAKLGGLAAITLALLWAGRRFRTAIPMTASAVFHLGALLIPFDMAAVAILAGQPWQPTLLMTAVVSVGAWFGIEWFNPSLVLRWAARAAMIFAAAGVAAVSPIGTPIVVAAVALAATALGRDEDATVWAIAAGLLPLAAIVSVAAWPATLAGAAADLGFDQADRGQLFAATIGSIVALVWLTHRKPNVELAWSAVAVAAVGATVLMTTIESLYTGFALAAVAFLGVELLAFATRRDPFWKPVIDSTAITAEVLAGLTTWALVLHAVDGLWNDVTAPMLSVAGVIMALAWLSADRRRLQEPVDWLVGIIMGADWKPATLFFPVAVLASVGAASSSSVSLAAAMVGLAAWLILTARTGGPLGAVVLSLLAVLVLDGEPAALMAAGGALGAIILTMGARWRIQPGIDPTADNSDATMLAGFAVLTWLAGMAQVLDSGLYWTAAVAVAGLWTLGVMLEVPRPATTQWGPSSIARIAAVGVTVVALWDGTSESALLAALVLAVLSGLDAVRSPGPVWFGIAGGVMPVIAVPALALAGVSTPWAGLALALAGLVLTGLALAVPRELLSATAMAAVVASSLGLVNAFEDPSALAPALVIVGLTLALAGAALRGLGLVGLGWLVITTGFWLQLALWGVTWMEAYLALPAVGAIVAGLEARRRGINSWGAYVPTIAILAFASFAERLAGGPAWHTVIAGAVGIAAVLAGGYARLVGPLLTGTGVLVVVAGYESLGPAALVPTWAWLALGGTVLLAAGIVIERTDTSPLETGRRVRDVIATQFA